MPQITLTKKMKDRIRQIMESQHMTQQVFAQFIEMSPASLSSIFNGRTKPTLNIIEAIQKKIPDINIQWLMFGSGPMYVKADHSTPAVSDTPPKTQSPLLEFEMSPSPTPEVVGVPIEKRSSATITSNSVKNTHPITPREEVKIIDKPQRRVTEIRVFYDDQTWESFVPAKTK